MSLIPTIPGTTRLKNMLRRLSFLIYTFASHRIIDDGHFNLIDERGIEEGAYNRLLVAACKLRVYKEAELLVDVFSYVATDDTNVVHLRPGDTRLEQSIRLGYIQSEFQKNLSLLRHFEEDDEPVATLGDMSKHVYSTLGAKIVKRLEKPFPRYALFLPEVDELLDPFRGDHLFREDAIYLEAIAREQYARPEMLLTYQLADGLTILDVVKIRRFLNFLRELMAQRLLPLFKTNPNIAMRSLLPVFRRDKLLRLLGNCVSESAAEAFLRIAAYDHTNSP